MEASSLIEAQELAEELPARDWNMQEDRITAVLPLKEGERQRT